MRTNFLKSLLILPGSFLFLSCTETPKNVFEYSNPLMTLTFRDTHIIPDNGKYYAVGTCTPVWGGQNPGVKLYESDNLTDWEYKKLLIDANELDSSVWYRDRFWAPELKKIGDRYFLTFNCQNNSGDYGDIDAQKHYHACGLAVSDHIEGPYTVVTPDKPLTSFASNDISLFEDTDGKVYAFYNNGWTDMHHIYVSELDLKSYTLKGTPTLLISQEPGKWDGAGIEGSHVVKKDGVYYMFYSSWTNGYAVGYATADNIYGPWVKATENPLFGSFIRNDSTFVVRSGITRYEPEFKVGSIGHNQIFVGPDGNYWTSYHGNIKGESEAITLIDPVEFENGRIITKTPTYTPQIIEFKESDIKANRKRNQIL